MGNVRNPVGPLPSSIYWRRRAVVACLLVLLVALVVWALTSTGGGGGRNAGAPGGGRSPLPSITPGPSASQTGITSEPGGSGTSGGSGSGGSGGSGGSAGSGAAGGSAGGAGGNAGTGGSGSGGGGSASGGSAGGGGLPAVSNPAPLPNSSNLPDCSSPQVRLTVRSVKSSYDPGQKPQFVLTAVNSGSSACKVNFGSTAAVVSVVNSSNSHVWSSDDCPGGASAYLLKVPANGSVSYAVQWDLNRNTSQCSTPSGGGAGPGTYEVMVSESGVGSGKASFVLNQYGS